MMRGNGCFIVVLALLFLLTPVYAQNTSFTVVIDAGHGGKDPGAIGSLVYEKTVNLAVAKKLGDLITANHKDVNVIYTRKTDVFVPLMERAEIANRNKADLFISIHANSIKNNNRVHGAETFTLGLAETEENLEVAMRENAVILEEDNYLQRYGFDPNTTESYIIFEFMQNKNLEQSVVLASEVQKAMTSTNRVNRGVRQAGFLVLRLTGMPGVLVELGYLSNKEEERFLRSNDGQNHLAKAIYAAFKSYKNKYGSNQVVEATGSSTNTAPASHTTSPVSTPPASTSANTTGQTVYKVQILSSNRQLPANSPSLKGYKADWYKDGNLYKYTYGESTDLKTIQDIQKQVSKDFKDAFIIRMKDGKRLN